MKPIIGGAYLRRSTTLMPLMDSLTTFYQKKKKKINGSNTTIVTLLLMNFKALGNFGPVLRNVSLVLRKDYPANDFKLLVSREMKWFQMVLISYCFFYI